MTPDRLFPYLYIGLQPEFALVYPAGIYGVIGSRKMVFGKEAEGQKDKNGTG
jgi:hypothetical protein